MKSKWTDERADQKNEWQGVAALANTANVLIMIMFELIMRSSRGSSKSVKMNNTSILLTIVTRSVLHWLWQHLEQPHTRQHVRLSCRTVCDVEAMTHHWKENNNKPQIRQLCTGDYKMWRNGVEKFRLRQRQISLLAISECRRAEQSRAEQSRAEHSIA